MVFNCIQHGNTSSRTLSRLWTKKTLHISHSPVHGRDSGCAERKCLCYNGTALHLKTKSKVSPLCFYDAHVPTRDTLCQHDDVIKWEFIGPGEFPAQRPVTRSFDVFFDLRLNKRLSKQPWGWWLRRHRGHYGVIVMGKRHVPSERLQSNTIPWWSVSICQYGTHKFLLQNVTILSIINFIPVNILLDLGYEIPVTLRIFNYTSHSIKI